MLYCIHRQETPHQKKGTSMTQTTKALGATPVRAIVRMARKSQRWTGNSHGEPGGIDINPETARQAVAICLDMYPQFVAPCRMADDKLATRRAGHYAHRSMSIFGERPITR